MSAVSFLPVASSLQLTFHYPLIDELSQLASAYKHAYLDTEQGVNKGRGRVVLKKDDGEGLGGCEDPTVWSVLMSWCFLRLRNSAGLSPGEKSILQPVTGCLVHWTHASSCPPHPFILRRQSICTDTDTEGYGMRY